MIAHVHASTNYNVDRRHLLPSHVQLVAKPLRTFHAVDRRPPLSGMP